MERKNVFVYQSFPGGRKFPEDLLCVQEVLGRVDTKGFESHRLVVPNPSPDIGSPARRNSNFTVFLESLKRSSRRREHQNIAGNIPERGYELLVFLEGYGGGLLMVVSVISVGAARSYHLAKGGGLFG